MQAGTYANGDGRESEREWEPIPFELPLVEPYPRSHLRVPSSSSVDDDEAEPETSHRVIVIDLA
jgi:hypothetical protein